MNQPSLSSCDLDVILAIVRRRSKGILVNVRVKLNGWNAESGAFLPGIKGGVTTHGLFLGHHVLKKHCEPDRHKGSKNKVTRRVESIAQVNHDFAKVVWITRVLEENVGNELVFSGLTQDERLVQVGNKHCKEAKVVAKCGGTQEKRLVSCSKVSERTLMRDKAEHGQVVEN